MTAEFGDGRVGCERAGRRATVLPAHRRPEAQHDALDLRPVDRDQGFELVGRIGLSGA